MVKFLKYGILIVLAVILILLILPFLVSLDHYREVITAQVKESTGRDLIIKDHLTFSLLPKPKVILSGIQLSVLPDEQSIPILNLDKAKVILSIMPLFTGKIEISDVILEKPIFYFEKLEANKNAQKLKIISSNKSPINTNSTSIKMPKLPFVINRLTIRQGKVTLVRDNKKFIFKDINIIIRNLLGQGSMEFAVNSKVFDKNFIFEGFINANQNIMPITAELKINGEKATIEGNFNLSELNFTGNTRLQGNAKHFTDLWPTIPKRLQKDYNLTALITANKEAIYINNLDFTIGKISATGKGSYNFQNAIPNLRLNIIPANILIKINKDQSPQSYKINMQSKTIKPFFDSLEIKNTDLPFLNNHISFDASISYHQNTADIKNISLLLGDTYLKGDITMKEQRKLNLSYNLQTNKGSALANLIGIKLPLTLSEVKIKGETSENNKIWQTDTYITLAGTKVHINGKIDYTKEYKPSLTLTANGVSLGNTLKQFLGKNISTSHLGAFSLFNTISGQMPIFEVVINKYDITIINSTKISLNGKANIDLSSKPKINIDLVTSDINLSSSQSNVNNTQKGVIGTQESQSVWSKEKIDLSFLNSFDGIFTVSIPQFVKSPFNIDTIKAKLKLTSGILTLDMIQGKLYGGSMKTSGHLIANTGEIFLKSQLKQARLKDVVQNYKRIKITDGNFNLSTNLQSKGNSEFQYINNLAGNIHLTGTNGRLSGISLQKVLNTFNNVQNFQGIMNLLESSFSGGETAFNSLESNMIIKEGIIHLTHFKLDNTDIVATANGNVNLPKYYLDVNSTIKVNTQTFPPFNVHFYGLLNNIEYKVDTVALKDYLAKNILTNVIDQIQENDNSTTGTIKGIIRSKKGKQDSIFPEDRLEKEENNNPKYQLKKEAEKLIKQGLKIYFPNKNT